VVKRLQRVVLMLALLALPWLGQATTAIFYQPLRSDRSLAEAHWPGLFAGLRAQGFDTLVVQWVQYGDAFADPAEHAWLLRRLREAQAAGLQLVLGLGGDPAFFERQKASAAALEGYLGKLARDDARIADTWANELGESAIAGWYLPLEIDDLHWREPGTRGVLLDYLRQEARQLRHIARRPVYVTSFFAGNMAPSSYAGLLADIDRSGVRAWVQDGAGTGRLSPAERRLYLEAASRCGQPGAQGIVYELFRQTGTDTAFSAVALPPPELAATLAQRAPCQGDSVFFELRYLPAAGALLQR
jgi:hypothetical protein